MVLHLEALSTHAYREQDGNGHRPAWIGIYETTEGFETRQSGNPSGDPSAFRAAHANYALAIIDAITGVWELTGQEHVQVTAMYDGLNYPSRGWQVEIQQDGIWIGTYRVWHMKTAWQAPR